MITADANGNCVVSAASLEKVYELLGEANTQMYSIENTLKDIVASKNRVSLLDIIHMKKKAPDVSGKIGRAMDILFAAAYFRYVKTDLTPYDAPCSAWAEPAGVKATGLANTTCFSSISIAKPVITQLPSVPSEGEKEKEEEEEEDLYA